MVTTFDITGDDIALLDDSSLRELIGLLCEADYRQAGLSVKGITWGGNQDAPDGGFDVVIQSEQPPPANSFIPRKATGIQVKKPRMPRAAITKEMKPQGNLREQIKSLIKEKGSYIIVSSGDSTTDKSLKERKQEMRNAIGEEAGHEDLDIDFFDRGRVATWVRMHPALILWVRNRIGRQLKGWKPYENWANTTTPNEEYLCDDGLRLHKDTEYENKGVSAEDGLDRLRAELSSPSKSIRLTGLSGVGKTRFVQALFDERIGKNALNKSHAFYTDISFGPAPDPRSFAEQLIASQTRGILIVDNCPPELHNLLTQTCSVETSTISLLTVEYDVRDNIPNETSVFRLEPATAGIITKLILRRFKHISNVDAQTIAEFSGGNARIAIALANTVQQGETLSGLRDQELFERLFRQRNHHSESLMASAEACSLVYSFQGEDLESDTSELSTLASLIGKSALDIYRDVAELKARDLVQSRSIWRAVLPQALANRLAQQALRKIPRKVVTSTFLTCDSTRLLQSFTRRLNFLHDCPAAVAIATEWLEKDGWLGENINNLNALGIEALQNIAPIVPEKALEAIERASNGEFGEQFTSRENPHHSKYVRLLRSLAYDQKLFKRCATIICRFALSEEPGNNYDPASEVLKSLFFIYLSGTWASATDRLDFIKELLASSEEEKQELGLLLIECALEGWHFSSSYDFSFGARPRDYGYEPKSQEELSNWYNTFIEACTDIALSNSKLAAKANRILAQKFRGLWTKAGMFDMLEQTAKKIHQVKPWNDGWLSVRQSIKFDEKRLKKDAVDRLHTLEEYLRPKNLIDQARVYGFSRHYDAYDLSEKDSEKEFETAHARIEEMTREIGAKVIQDDTVFQTLLPEIVSTNGMRLSTFGEGLAQGCSDKKDLWNKLKAQLTITPEKDRSINALFGVISCWSKLDPAFTKELLEDILDDEILAPWAINFEIAARGIEGKTERVNKAFDKGTVPIWSFEPLIWDNDINDDELAKLLNKMLSRKNGIDVALDMAHMRLRKTNGDNIPHSKSLILTARKILSAFEFSSNDTQPDLIDHHLSGAADKCLKGDESLEAATSLARNLSLAITKGKVYAFHYKEIISTLAKLHPHMFLDIFLEETEIENYQKTRIFSSRHNRDESPSNHITDADIISWCEINPTKRYPMIVQFVKLFARNTQTGELEWRETFNAIVRRAPDLDSVLNEISAGLHPSSWNGPLSDILQSRANLMQKLFDHENTKISAWARSVHSTLKEAIATQREFENNRTRERDERFE